MSMRKPQTTEEERSSSKQLIGTRKKKEENVNVLFCVSNISMVVVGSYFEN